MSAIRFPRVDEYARTTVNGQVYLIRTGHGHRINPNEVVRIYTAGIGYEDETLSVDHNVFSIYLTNGQRVYTDWAGVETLQGA